MSQEQIADADLIPNLGYSSVDERKTEELIFAFVEPIGGGASKAFDELINILKSPPYNYEINPITTREIINTSINELKNTGHPFTCDPSKLKTSRGRDIFEMQEKGNFLRKTYGNDYIAYEIIRRIAKYRKDHNGFEKSNGDTLPVPKPLRVAHIIRSLKHEAEFEKLKSIYGGILFLIGITGRYETRLENFDPDDTNKVQQENRLSDFEFLSGKDQYEGLSYGQRVRKVFYLSDLFLDSTNNKINSSLRRFIGLLFSQSIMTPLFDERMMHTAYTASLMSSCLSRQVGAAIANKSNELIGVGWNDIPRAGGGLASDEGSQSEKESLCKYIGYCNTNKKINELISSIYNQMKDKKLLNVSYDKFSKLMKETPIANLIEFSRAIHAEMAAILSIARDGKGALRDSTLYVTTYPCDNCMKHILASGISKVYFIEPYPKSRANEFYSKYLSDSSQSTDKSPSIPTLDLIQYTGVSPSAFELLYKASQRKDENGDLYINSAPPKPKTQVFLDSYTLYETYIAREAIKNKLGSSNE